MSADNMLLVVQTPKRDARGFEWRVADIGFSGYEDNVWQSGKKGYPSDALLVAMHDFERSMFQPGLFFSERDVDALEARLYRDEYVVEYGCSFFRFDFPWPTKEIIHAALVRWEASKPERELQQRLKYFQM